MIIVTSGKFKQRRTCGATHPWGAPATRGGALRRRGVASIRRAALCSAPPSPASGPGSSSWAWRGTPTPCRCCRSSWAAWSGTGRLCSAWDSEGRALPPWATPSRGRREERRPRPGWWGGGPCSALKKGTKGGSSAGIPSRAVRLPIPSCTYLSPLSFSLSCFQ